MQPKSINKLNVSSKILILFLILCILLVAKSIFLIMLITVLDVIILILVDKNVKLYVDTLKKYFFWLLFFAIVYIMIFRDVLGLVVLLYKIILIFGFLVSFMESVSFSALANGIYTLISPLDRILPRLDKKAYEFSSYIYFIKYLMNSGKKIKEIQQVKNSVQVNVKYYLLPRLFTATNKIKELEDDLKLSFYKVQKENVNSVSFAFVLFFVILFVTAIFKEVIL